MLACSSIFFRLGTNWFPGLDATQVRAKLVQASLKNFTSHILKDIGKIPPILSIFTTFLSLSFSNKRG